MMLSAWGEGELHEQGLMASLTEVFGKFEKKYKRKPKDISLFVVREQIRLRARRPQGVLVQVVRHDSRAVVQQRRGPLPDAVEEIVRAVDVRRHVSAEEQHGGRVGGAGRRCRRQREKAAPDHGMSSYLWKSSSSFHARSGSAPPFLA